MNFFILVLLICFFISLYVLYVLSKDDFVILRSDVPLHRIFNAAFSTAIFSLFFARLFFVIFNPNSLYASVLGFFLFPYFPGLSLAGGILGGFAFLTIYLKLKHLPILRLLDFFSMSLLVSYPIGFLGHFLLSKEAFSKEAFVSLILIAALLFLFARYVLPASLSGKIKDGTAFLCFLLSVSILSVVINIFEFKHNLSLENLLFILILVPSFLTLFKYEIMERLIFRNQ